MSLLETINSKTISVEVLEVETLQERHVIPACTSHKLSQLEASPSETLIIEKPSKVEEPIASFMDILPRGRRSSTQLSKLYQGICLSCLVSPGKSTYFSSGIDLTKENSGEKG